MWKFFSTTYILLIVYDFSSGHKDYFGTYGSKRVKREELPCYSHTLEDEDLCFQVSPIRERQIAVVNISSDLAVVIDPNNDQFAILQGDGHGIVYDQNMDVAFETTEGEWKMNVATYAPEAQLANITQNLVPIDGESIKADHSISRFIKTSLMKFGSSIKDLIFNAGDHIISVVKKIFSFIIHPIRSVLGPILDFALKGWNVIKGGLLAFLNVFKWMGQFVSKVTGGIGTLIGKSVRFSLDLVTKAINGVRAFVYLLDSIVSKFDISHILRAIISVPSQIAHFIFGLGGEVLKGVTGLFKIVGSVIDFIFSIIKGAVKSLVYIATRGIKELTNLVMKFFGYRPTDTSEIESSADEMLEIVDKQDELYHNRQELQNYEKFWRATKGEGDLDVHGVNLGSIIKALLGNSYSSPMDLIMKILDTIKNAVPATLSLPTLLYNSIKSLNRHQGIDDVKLLIPDLDIPNEGLTSYRTLTNEVDEYLPTSELIERFPIARSVFLRMQESALRHANISLSALINSETMTTIKLRSALINYGSI